MFRKISSLVLISMLTVVAAGPIVAYSKEKKPKLIKYKKDSGVGLGAFGGKLLHSYGYKDKKLENGNWKITGAAKSKLGEHSKYIAIYRASEIATSQNKKYIKVLSVNGKNLNAAFGGSMPSGGTFSGGSISYGTRYIMEINFSDFPDETANCAENVLRVNCKTIEAAAAIEEVRPHLKIKKRR